MKGILNILILLLVLAACSMGNKDDVNRELSQSLGIEIKSSEVITQSDSHGGFHGDGSTFIEMQFADNTLLEQLKDNTNWKELPLTDNITALVYGHHKENVSIGPVIHGEDYAPLIPIIENGYYFFEDRHPQSTDSQDVSKVLGRNSYNFTIAIYDMETQTLYYMELDT